MPPPAPDGPPRRRNMFEGMWEVQDAHGVTAMVVQKALQPGRPVLHARYRRRRPHPAAVAFDHREARERVRGGQAGKIAQILRVRAPLPPLVGAQDHAPNGGALDLGPGAVGEGHHHAIGADLQPLVRLRAGVGGRRQGGGGGGLDGDQVRAGGFGQAAGAGGTHPDTGEGDQQRSRGSKGHPGAEPHQVFDQAGGQTAGQQAEFLIQGGKARFHRPGR